MRRGTPAKLRLCWDVVVGQWRSADDGKGLTGTAGGAFFCSYRRNSPLWAMCEERTVQFGHHLIRRIRDVESRGQ